MNSFKKILKNKLNPIILIIFIITFSVNIFPLTNNINTLLQFLGEYFICTTISASFLKYILKKNSYQIFFLLSFLNILWFLTNAILALLLIIITPSLLFSKIYSSPTDKDRISYLITICFFILYIFTWIGMDHQLDNSFIISHSLPHTLWEHLFVLIFIVLTAIACLYFFRKNLLPIVYKSITIGFKIGTILITYLITTATFYSFITDYDSMTYYASFAILSSYTVYYSQNLLSRYYNFNRLIQQSMLLLGFLISISGYIMIIQHLLQKGFNKGILLLFCTTSIYFIDFCFDIFKLQKHKLPPT